VALSNDGGGETCGGKCTRWFDRSNSRSLASSKSVSVNWVRFAISLSSPNNDVAEFQPRLPSFLSAYGYLDDWLLADKPSIRPQHGSEFVRRTVEFGTGQNGTWRVHGRRDACTDALLARHCDDRASSGKLKQTCSQSH
jgi:hypothetical protein